MTPDRLTLEACSPTPLASYLKTLGVLRLLSSATNSVAGEPADPNVRGWWAEERFHLRTSLGRSDLLRFFLEDYAPSPVIGPWNGRAGFLEGEEGGSSTREGAVLIREIDQSASSRLQLMRSSVRQLRSNDDLVTLDRFRAESKALGRRAKTLRGEEKREVQERKKLVDAKAKVTKAKLLPSLRSTIGDAHVAYVDSCFVISPGQQAAKAAPLLGAGGVDGSRDFGVRFAAALKQLFSFDTGQPCADSERSLRSALFKTVVRLETSGSIGMFNPGGGGPNATVGYAGENPLNHWEVVLTMEGTIVFAGALTRRWDSNGQRRASFPFSFEPTQAGSGVFSSVDPHRPRGEIWTPIWKRPARYSEVRALFAEGRLTVGGRTARDGLGAARAVEQIGVSRGITGFERYSFVQPGPSLPYQATPLGRIRTPRVGRPDLIADLEVGEWLQAARRAAGNKTAPGRAKATMHELENALFAMTDGDHSGEGTEKALIALGRFAAWLSASPKSRDVVAPPPLLSRSWLLRADDGSPEYRVAAALAGIGIPPSYGERSGPAESEPDNWGIPPMAAHFAPLTNGPGDGFERRTFFRGGRLLHRRAWAADNTPPTVVWGHGGLMRNMIAVLDRRIVEASIRRLEDKPLGSATFARLSDVAAFLAGNFDDTRCSELLAGMVWTQPVRLPAKESDTKPAPVTLPFAYAALKPIFSLDDSLVRVGAIPSQGSMPLPPDLLGPLRAGGASRDGREIAGAVRSAFSRARSSGLISPYDPVQSGSGLAALRSSRIGVGARPDRMAAAMLIPISYHGLASLLRRAYPGALPDSANHSSEETPNVS